ncbi:MAG: hypothetical protein SFV17_13470 [Candidatus Obscuribacter sp.]|nr:hypothetical protein [Candidatus Obscuribacter sp.]
MNSIEQHENIKVERSDSEPGLSHVLDEVINALKETNLGNQLNQSLDKTVAEIFKALPESTEQHQGQVDSQDAKQNEAGAGQKGVEKDIYSAYDSAVNAWKNPGVIMPTGLDRATALDRELRNDQLSPKQDKILVNEMNRFLDSQRTSYGLPTGINAQIVNGVVRIVDRNGRPLS